MLPTLEDRILGYRIGGGSVDLPLLDVLQLFSAYFGNGGGGGEGTLTSWEQILNKPLTINDFGITDAYTKDQTKSVADASAAAAVATLTAGAPDTFNSFVDAYNQFLTNADAAASILTQLGGKLTTANALSEFLVSPSMQAQARANLGLGDAATKNVADLPSGGGGSSTPAWADVTGKPLTLAGFGITDAYTKAQTDTVATNAANAAFATLTAGAPADLDSFAEAYNRFLADENAATALNTQVAGKASKAANLSDLTDVAQARTNLQLGTAARSATTDFEAAGTALLKTANLAGLTDKPAARGNLGLTDAQFVPTTGTANGKFLGYVSGAPAWVDAPTGGGGGTGTALPTGGKMGQVLTQTDDATTPGLAWRRPRDAYRRFEVGSDFLAFGNGTTGTAGGASNFQWENFNVITYGAAGFGARQAPPYDATGPAGRTAENLGYFNMYTGAVSGNSVSVTLGHAVFRTGSGRFRVETGVVIPAAPGTVAQGYGAACEARAVGAAATSGMQRYSGDNVTSINFGWKLSSGTAATRTLIFYHGYQTIDTGVVPVAGNHYHMAFEVDPSGTNWTVEWTDNSGVFHSQTSTFTPPVGTPFAPLFGLIAGQASSVGIFLDYFFVTYEPTNGRT